MNEKFKIALAKKILCIDGYLIKFINNESNHFHLTIENILYYY